MCQPVEYFPYWAWEYHSYTYLWSLSHWSSSDLHFPCIGFVCMYQHRTELCFFTGEPDNAHKSQCWNSFCHPRVTLLSGSAIPFLALGGRGWKFQCSGHHELSATEPGFVAVSLQLALNHNTINLNSAFEIQHHMVIFGCWWNTERQQNSWQEYFWEERKNSENKTENEGSIKLWVCV